MGSDQCLYGGAFEVLAATAGRILPFGLYESRHLVNVAFGLLAIFACYGLGMRLGGPWAALLSSLFLATTPTFYGHMFNNPKDIPFAALFACSLWALVSVLQSLPSPPWGRVVALGLFMGGTIGVRVGGVILFVYVFVFVALSRSQAVFRAAVVPCFLAWVVMLPFWPWALVSPIAHPLQALGAITHFRADWSVLFNGRFVRAEAPPPGYLPVWFLNCLPEFYFVALAAGAIQAVRSSWASRRTMEFGLLVAAVVVPVGVVMAMGSTLYDGVRHFLFILPPLSVLSGVSVAHAFRGRGGIVLSIAVLASWASTTADMVSLHPYESVYFNRLVGGGLRGAAGRFETDYWGASYKEAVEWVLESYRPPVHERIRVANCSNRILTGYYLEKTWEQRQIFESVGKAEDPHLFLATTNRECHKGVSGRLLHVVERQGVALAYVFEVRRPR